MKTLPSLTLTAVLLSLSASAFAAPDAKKPAKKPAPADKEEPAKEEPAAEKPAAEAKLSKEQSALQAALENHGQLKGFHVEVTLKTAEGNATMTGSLGLGPSNSTSCLKSISDACPRFVVRGESLGSSTRCNWSMAGIDSSVESWIPRTSTWSCRVHRPRCSREKCTARFAVGRWQR